MKPFSSPPYSRSSSGGAAFTLIELLVVISIIAVLAGLLLPVVSKVTENARKVSAKSTETQVVSAINSYQTDYGQYPVAATTTTTATPTDTTFGVDGHNMLLFNALRSIKTGDAAQDGLNSRQIVYFEGKNVKSVTVPKDGFILSGTTNAKSPNGKTLSPGDMVDPWGYPYFIRVDTSYSNVLVNPYSDNSANATDTTTPTEANVLRLGSICYSWGSDGTPGLNNTPPPSPYTNIGDDVVSWQ